MVCRKCGKIVLDSDLFCTHCGTVLVSFDNEKPAEAAPPVKEEVPVPEPVKAAPESNASPVIVLSGKKDPVLKPQPEKAPARESEFVWNVYDFPKPQSQKTEEVKFSWDTSVLEMTKAQEKEKKMEEELFGELDARMKEKEASVPVEPAEAFAEVPAEDSFVISDFGQESSPISDDLFRELFGDEALLKSLEEEAWNEEIGGEEPLDQPAESPLSQPETESSPADNEAEGNASLTEDPWEKDLFAELTLPPEAEGPDRHPEKFFTFTQKNEEFQRLLDREYERMQKMSSPRAATPLAPQETRRYPSRNTPAVSFADSFPARGEAREEKPGFAETTPPLRNISPCTEVAQVSCDEVREEMPEPVNPAPAPMKPEEELLQALWENSPTRGGMVKAPEIVFKDTAPLPKVPAELKMPEAPAPAPVAVDPAEPRPAVPPIPGVAEGVGAAAAVSPIAQAVTRREKKAPFKPTPEEAKTIFLEVHEEKFRANMWNEEDYEKEKPRRSAGRYIGRTILILIIVILVLEVASLATLFFAAESKFAPLAEKFQEKTLGLVMDVKERFESAE